MVKEDLLKGLTPEQIEKAKKCKNVDELLKFAKKEGIELSNEQLAAVNGGCGTKEAPNEICPNCGANNVVYHDILIGWDCECRACGHKYKRYAEV